MLRKLAILLLLILTVPAMAQDPANQISPPKISPLLAETLSGSTPIEPATDGTWSVWVHFADKGVFGTELEAALATVEQNLPQRALQRRSRVKPAGERLVDGTDLPVATTYLEAVAATGARARQQSRWLNAASFDANREQIATIAQLPFVKKVSLVAKFFRPEPQINPEEKRAAEQAMKEAEFEAADRWSLDYGGSTAGLEQINVPPVHELGVSGQGIVVGMLDSGFRTTHIALQHIPILDQWDFVDDDPIVDEEPGDPLYSARHGTQTLSTIMGFENGYLVGPAFEASVILARTEDIGDETPIEEDNWVAGLEWVESLGADLVSSSLGYYYWYEFSDLDGNTAVTSVAADAAVGRGMGVYTSAGNERENPDWPHITAPADGDSVIAMAAVDVDGVIASFSSPGPTYDGRIKPDLSARGVNSFVASYYDDSGYHGANGTSFACPLVAGVAALMLERIPTLTPMQVREALRMTANRADNPDNDYGWGIVDAYAALTYWGPNVQHTPLPETEDTVGPYLVVATITSRDPLDPGTLYLYWRVDGGAWTQVMLASAGGDHYSADIPGQATGGLVEYYLEAGDIAGLTLQYPHGGPDNPYGFSVGVDVTPPDLFHATLIDQIVTIWPPVIYAKATDNLGIDRIELTFSHNGGPTQGPFTLAANGEVYELAFPHAGPLSVGDEFVYELNCWDTASTPNQVTSGPHTFFVVADRGHVLVINDDPIGAESVIDEAAKDAGSDPRLDVNSSASRIAQWLIDSGYIVDLVNSDDVGPGSFLGYDAVVLSCGNNTMPIGNATLREEMINWSYSGGRILVEGGAVCDAALYQWPGYPEFAAAVLHADEWWGSIIEDRIFYLQTGQEQHYFANRPYLMPPEFEYVIDYPGYDFGAADASHAAPEAMAIYRTDYNARVGGVLIYDDNTGPEAGQIVYFTFDTGYLDDVFGKKITENALAYLLGREAPGDASILGTVTLADSEDASGVTVSVGPDHSVVTGPDGAYALLGLHGATYTVTATKEGYGPAQQVVVLGADQQMTGIDFELQPIIEVNVSVSPNLPIPDNDPAGVYSVITLAEEGDLYAINVDINLTHPSIGQLIVRLTSPTGTEVTLHNHTGSVNDDIIGNWPQTLSVDGPGALADFLGETIQGDWTLHVADTQFGAMGGVLQTWGLNLQATAPVISALSDRLPAVTRVMGNAPNPFNPQTVISFELAHAGPVQLDIFDVRGHLVRRLLVAELQAGRHDVPWNGRDNGNRETASGVYFCRLNAAGQTDLHKMTLVR